MNQLVWGLGFGIEAVIAQSLPAGETTASIASIIVLRIAIVTLLVVIIV